MIFAVDVYYREGFAKAVGILFEWNDTEPRKIISEHIHHVEEYTSGQFYKRELPCIIQLIKQIDLSQIETILIDGYVFIDNNQMYGLGAHLWEKLNKEKCIIGVAKKAYYGTQNVCFPVYRGMSRNPLFISSIGINPLKAQLLIKNMQGEYRIPSLLKILDQQTKL